MLHVRAGSARGTSPLFLTAEPRSAEQPLSYTLLPLAMAAGNMMNCAKSLELSACIPKQVWPKQVS